MVIRGRLTNRIKKRIKYILGESIYDHSLIKDNPQAIAEVSKCENIKQVVKILEKRYNQKNSIILPGGRDLYSRFKNELHPDFKPVEP